jgi:hypothetical protein
MGLLNNIGRGASAWATAGLSELGRKDPFGLGGGTGVPGAPPRPPLTAAGIQIPSDLTAAFGNIGQNAQQGIQSNYTNLNQQRVGEAGALGRPAASNSYTPQRMGVQQGLDVGNLEGALGGVEGNTAYENAIQNRGYNQNLSLAQETAALNKPSLLDQIFQGVGAVGRPMATYAGMKGRGGGSGTSSAPTVASFPYDTSGVYYG